MRRRRSNARKRRRMFGFLDDAEIKSLLKTIGLAEKKPTLQERIVEVSEELQSREYVAIYDELVNIPDTCRLSIEQQIPPEERRTMRGYPVGKDVYEPEWRVEIGALAYTKLMAWDKARHGLELSGYALLKEPAINAVQGEEYVFEIDDIMLVCALEESSGGYTEMSPQQRVQGMMWARENGRSANCLVWWHIHPINTWSGIDVNTCRQRVHETGITDERLATLSFVLCPAHILARLDQANPNIFVDKIPVFQPDTEEATVVLDEMFSELSSGDRGFPFYGDWEEAGEPTGSELEYKYTNADWRKLIEQEEEEYEQGRIPEWPIIGITARTYIEYAPGVVVDTEAEEETEEEEAE